MKKWIVLSITIGFMSVILGAPMTAQAAKAIKVGIVDSYSGGAAPMAIDNLNGFKMAINAINAKGGIGGTKIEFVTRDDKFKPDIALAMAKELVMREKVDILMGTVSSACCLAISEYARKEKVRFINTGSKSEKITGEKGHRYIFSMDENTAMIGRAVAPVSREETLRKVLDCGRRHGIRSRAHHRGLE